MLGFESFEAFYKSDLQGIVATTVVPALFLVYLLVGPRPAPSRGVDPPLVPFLHLWAITFALETILDPIATGLVPRWLELGDGAATVILVFFVMLGDFRLLLPFFRLARTDASLGAVAGQAAAWTLVVPIAAFAFHSALAAAVPGLPSQTIWLVYEIGFVGLALVLRFVWVPRHVVEGARRGYVEDLVEYALGYYLLWAAADVLILAGGLDAGWALRVIPNQLYYSFTVPFAYLRFFTAKRR